MYEYTMALHYNANPQSGFVIVYGLSKKGELLFISRFWRVGVLSGVEQNLFKSFWAQTQVGTFEMQFK